MVMFSMVLMVNNILVWIVICIIQYKTQEFQLAIRSCVTLRFPSLDSETGWTGELW